MSQKRLWWKQQCTSTFKLDISINNTLISMGDSWSRYLRKHPIGGCFVRVHRAHGLFCKKGFSDLLKLLFKVSQIIYLYRTRFLRTPFRKSFEDIFFPAIKGIRSGPRQFFYFTLKVLFVLKLFKFLSQLFDHVKKRLK